MKSVSRLLLIALLVLLTPTLCVQSSEPNIATSTSQGKDTSVPFIGVALIIDHSSLLDQESTTKATEQSLHKLGFQVARISALEKKATLQQVTEFCSTLPTNSQLLVYYVGPLIHGEQKIQSKYVPATFLVPKGFNFKNKKEIRSACVGIWELEQLFVKSGCKQFVLLADPVPLASENDELNKLQRFSQGDGTGINLGEFDSEHGSFIAVGDPASHSISTAIQKSNTLGELVNHARTVSTLKMFTTSFNSDVQLIQNQNLENSRNLRSGSKAGDTYINSIGQVFCWVPAGTYSMGSPESETDRSYDEKQQTISFENGYWISKYEVTEREYLAATRRNSRNSVGKNFPYTDARNGDANRFADSLNKLESGTLSGWKYELPDEGLWEYACRAGSNKAFCFGDDKKQLYRFGNFADSSLLKFNPSEYRYASQSQNDRFAKLAPVGSFLPNAWGIHDMHGNVWEWCSNQYRTEFSTQPNKEKPFNDRGKSIRGGSWLSQDHYCRSAMRNAQHDLNSAPHIGFRVILRKSR